MEENTAIHIIAIEEALREISKYIPEIGEILGFDRESIAIQIERLGFSSQDAENMAETADILATNIVTNQ